MHKEEISQFAPSEIYRCGGTESTTFTSLELKNLSEQLTLGVDPSDKFEITYSYL